MALAGTNGPGNGKSGARPGADTVGHPDPDDIYPRVQQIESTSGVHGVSDHEASPDILITAEATQKIFSATELNWK